MAKPNKISEHLPEGERLLLSAYANRIGFWGGPNGRLILTNKRLLFTNRRETILRNEVHLSDVMYVSDASSASIWSLAMPILIFFRNAVWVCLRDQSSFRFVISDKRKWIALIDEERRKIGPSTIPQHQGVSL